VDWNLIERTYDLDVILKAVSQYRENIVGFYPEDWINDTRNLAFVNEFGDIALFEWNYEGVYTGHYFFFSRGKEALAHARQILSLVFPSYEAKAIRGIVKLTHLGARWMTKKLGFKSYGIVHTPNGPEELFVLTKDEWENK